MALTPLRKPVVRANGRLVVTIDKSGVVLRRRGSRKKYAVPYAEIAKLAARNSPPAKPGWTAKQWENPLETILGMR